MGYSIKKADEMIRGIVGKPFRTGGGPNAKELGTVVEAWVEDNKLKVKVKVDGDDQEVLEKGDLIITMLAFEPEPETEPEPEQ